MNVVTYSCDCGYHAYEDATGWKQLCKKCHSHIKRYTMKFGVKEVTTPIVNITYKDNPRYSYTLGVQENQIEEARKLHPEAEWKKFGNVYRPLIKNRADKIRMMRQAGMIEYDSSQYKGKEGLFDRRQN